MRSKTLPANSNFELYCIKQQYRQPTSKFKTKDDIRSDGGTLIRFTEISENGNASATSGADQAFRILRRGGEVSCNAGTYPALSLSLLEASLTPLE